MGVGVNVAPAHRMCAVTRIIARSTLLVKSLNLLHARGRHVGVVLPQGIEHRDDVLRRDVGQDVVDLLEDKAAAAVQDLDLPADVLPDVVPRGLREHEPRVAAAAPEGDLVAEVGLQPRRVHAGTGDLHRIHRVEAGLDQVGKQRPDAAAGVEHDLDVGQLLGSLP